MNLSLRTVVLTLAASVSLAACGGGSSGGTTPSDSSSRAASDSTAPSDTATAPADEAAAKAEITRVWTRFFHTGTPRSAAVGLLEDGENLGGALDVAEQEDKDTGLTRRAIVKRIDFTNATNAAVTWVLLNKKTPLLPNASGTAVLQDGHWKVSKLTFCTLVNLGANGKEVPGCPA